VADLGAVEDDAALLVTGQAVDASQQGRLARAGRAADDDALAPPDGERDAAQDMGLAVPRLQILDLELKQAVAVHCASRSRHHASSRRLPCDMT
jgi:hypothetical protein